VLMLSTGNTITKCRLNIVEWFQPEEKGLVREMTTNMALPRNIIPTLERDGLKKFIQSPKTEIQHLMKCLVEVKYMYNQ
jgi:hypothetical protein